MTPCKLCSKETVSMFYNTKDGFWSCRDCYENPPQRIVFGVKHYWSDGKGEITSAHLDDIKHRTYDFSDKRVKRDTGRKYI